MERKRLLENLNVAFDALSDQRYELNRRVIALRDAQNQVQTLLAKGDRILAEREIFRKRAASIIHGYRTRDLGFRTFRNEALEQYQTLFDLAAKYAYLAAKAYDYDTGLLGSAEGASFLNDIVASRALGLLDEDGTPIFAASETGDPGLSGLLAKISNDWSVVRSRLGFNNPDPYGTTFSLRHESSRLLPGIDGDAAWRERLEGRIFDNLLEDPDVANHCLQIGDPDGIPVPGIIIEFSTSIQDGYNFFGNPLAAGDSAYSTSSFATKVNAVGVVFEGYIGINPELFRDYGDPPHVVSTDPNGLSATPYVYLIPVGTDLMRAPPLGDAADLRSWTVHDHALPLPFNLGANDNSDFDFWKTADSLSEEFFIPRKHQAFRAVDDPAYFYNDFTDSFTNRRLIGRSVWNTKWKLVIPARTLLNDEDEGLNRFLRTVTDIKLHLKTYSYAGN